MKKCAIYARVNVAGTEVFCAIDYFLQQRMNVLREQDALKRLHVF